MLGAFSSVIFVKEKSLIASKNAKTILEAKQTNRCLVVGIIRNVKTIMNKKGQEMAFVKIFDEEIKEKMKKRIDMKFQEITEFLKEKTKNIDKDGMYINIFEKIISSNMEE